MSKVLVVAGPTASGKTAVSVALAQKLNGEIISADSMQIYRDIQIGTARPTKEEMGNIPHHLLGFLPLSESFSVAQYAKLAKEKVKEIESRGHLPIFCGGTGLYLKAVLENIEFSEAKVDLELRNRLKTEIETIGGEAMLQKLKEFDPETAAILHANDFNRIIRAFEVYETTGSTITEQRLNSKRVPSDIEATFLVLDYQNRDTLYHRIHKRVDLMLEAGLLQEAEEILRTPYAPTAMQAIGYKELFPYFQGDISLDEAVENLKISTRHYAKRQLSWFRHVDGAQFVYMDDFDHIDAVVQYILETYFDT